MSEQQLLDFELDMALVAEEIDDLVSQFRLRTSTRRLSYQSVAVVSPRPHSPSLGRRKSSFVGFPQSQKET